MLNAEFFPTPAKLISRILAGINWGEIEGEASYAKVVADPGNYIIEPSGMLQLTGGAP